MRISRTPFRISFLGGGSDYPAWHHKHIGMVLGATIDKYCYIFYHPDQEKFRILYSQLEECDEVEDIKHPAVKAVLQYLSAEMPSSIIHSSDLPSRSGIGSSSAFVVGLLNAIVCGQYRWDKLAKMATEIEQVVLKEPVGNQDQILCAIGGINQIVWHPTGDYAVRPIEISDEKLKSFHSHLMLLRTHTRSNIAPEPLKFPVAITQRLAQTAKEGADILLHGYVPDFGQLLHESWGLKKQMSSSISDGAIDEMYQAALDMGATGGKLLGAGGGGFLLVFADPKYHLAIKNRIGQDRLIEFQFTSKGSILVYED